MKLQCAHVVFMDILNNFSRGATKTFSVVWQKLLAEVFSWALKMQDMKMQDMKLTDRYARHEIAGHEIVGHEIAGHELTGHAKAKQKKLAQKRQTSESK